MQLNGVATVITGGSTGLGRATAERFAKAGAKVAILDINTEQGAACADAVGGRFIETDAADEVAVARALDEAQSHHGVARVLVNCAGVALTKRIIGENGEPHSAAAFRRVIEINLIGTFVPIAQFAARLASAAPIGEERGVVVNTASVAAYDGRRGHMAYSASKSGVAGMTLPLARDLAEHLIRVVSIAPGYFDTQMVGRLSDEVKASFLSEVPHPQRMGAPAEFAQLVADIVANPMLNGEVIRIDAAVRMGTARF